MGLLARVKKVFGRKKRAPEPPKRVVPVRRPTVEVAAKALRTWAPPPEIVEGPLTPLEIVMAATERAVASAPPPPPPPRHPVLEALETRRRPGPGERVVHLVFEDGSMVLGDETSEAARLAYLGRNIFDGARSVSG
jgi:hypothetical protein